jgi:hypothetical protein
MNESGGEEREKELLKTEYYRGGRERSGEIQHV